MPRDKTPVHALVHMLEDCENLLEHRIEARKAGLFGDVQKYERLIADRFEEAFTREEETWVRATS